MFIALSIEKDYAKRKMKVVIIIDALFILCYSLGELNLLQKFTDEAGLTLNLLYQVESKEIHPVKFEILKPH